MSVRIRDCKNVYVSGLLVYCACCRRVIGHIDSTKYLLKDVRLMYFVPLFEETISGTQFICIRAAERGPVKRKHVSNDWYDIYDEPLYKKSRYSHVQSVICAHVRVEKNELIQESDGTEVSRPTNFANFIYDSSDDTEFFSDFEDDFLDEYYSDSDSDLEGIGESDHEFSRVSFSSETLAFDRSTLTLSRSSTPLVSQDEDFALNSSQAMPVGKCCFFLFFFSFLLKHDVISL